MSINNVLNHERTKRKEMILGFSKVVTTTSLYLNGCGGNSGDGHPLPKAGRILSINCWDGTNLVTSTGSISFSAGDRLSVYAAASGGKFDVTARINGVDTALAANALDQSTTLWASVLVQLG